MPPAQEVVKQEGMAWDGQVPPPPWQYTGEVRMPGGYDGYMPGEDGGAVMIDGMGGYGAGFAPTMMEVEERDEEDQCRRKRRNRWGPIESEVPQIEIGKKKRRSRWETADDTGALTIIPKFPKELTLPGGIRVRRCALVGDSGVGGKEGIDVLWCCVGDPAAAFDRGACAY